MDVAQTQRPAPRRETNSDKMQYKKRNTVSVVESNFSLFTHTRCCYNVNNLLMGLDMTHLMLLWGLLNEVLFVIRAC